MTRFKETPMLSLPDAIRQATQRIFQINGRARRSEYWWTRLMVAIANIFLTPFFGWVLNLLTIPLTIRRLHDSGRSGWWYIIYAIFTFLIIPIFFIDTFKMIWGFHENIDPDARLIYEMLLKYFFLALAVVIYKIVLVVLCCIDSDKTTNRYGESPKYTED